MAQAKLRAERADAELAQIESTQRAAQARIDAARRALTLTENDVIQAEAATRVAAEKLQAARDATAHNIALQEAEARSKIRTPRTRRLVPAPDGPLEPDVMLLSDKKPRPRTRWGLIGISGAFCAAALAVYMVPRFFPERTPEATAQVATRASGAAPGGAVNPAAALPPLYAPDAKAKRDLTLSYELKAAPAKP